MRQTARTKVRIDSYGSWCSAVLINSTTFQPSSLALGNAIRSQQVEKLGSFEITCPSSSLLFHIQYRRTDPKKLLLTCIFLQHTCLNNIWRHQAWIVN